MSKVAAIATAAAAGVAAVSAAIWFLKLKRNELDKLPIYVLKSDQTGMEVHVTPVGGCILKLIVPDKDGQPVDVVLGYDRASRYMVSPDLWGRPAHCSNTCPLHHALPPQQPHERRRVSRRRKRIPPTTLAHWLAAVPTGLRTHSSRSMRRHTSFRPTTA